MREGNRVHGGLSLGIAVWLGALAGCTGDGNDLIDRAVPPAPPEWTSSMPAGERMLFFDDFQRGLPAWEPMAGDWDVTGDGSYTATRRDYALSYAGNPNWSNYNVSAQVIVDDDRQGQVGVVGRGDSDHYYFELLLGRTAQGRKGWVIRQRRAHQWTTLAAGPFEYQLGTPYVMRLSFHGLKLQGSISRDGGRSFETVGTVEAPTASWQVGRAGVVTYGGAARFDDLGVSSVGPIIAAVDTSNGWGPITLLRDDTTTFGNGKPSGGWYVTPIHVTLRPDGKVLVTGFSRKGASNCTNGSSGTQRQNGMTWLLDPAVLDSNPDGATLFTTPIDEQNVDTTHDVLYCAGHSPMADGRIFFTAGTRYPSTLPNSSPERGLRYSRIFDGGTSLIRVANNAGTYHLMEGGQNDSYPNPGGGTVRGEKWYPTTLLMPDSRILIFGGFHWSSGGPGSKPNNSFEVYDAAAWDANHNTYPYAVLTQHVTTGLSADLPPTRGYSNMLLLPRPVPAGSAGGFARSVAIYGGKGRVALFNHEPGSFAPDTARLFARPNALTISPEGTPANERAEGGSGVLLSDGRIMVFNGGHTGDGARRAYVYDPYNDIWQSPAGAACTTASCSLDTTVSRMYGQAVQLPDGQVMILNGYGAQSGNGATFEEDGNESDIASAVGDPRQPVLVDPYASPMTATPQVVWPEPTHRGYHSVSLLLKDGRILTGGGKDRTHFTGCEKNELRIYTPPALRGNPTRPAITNVSNGQSIQVGGPNLTITYSGSLRSARGVALVSLGSLTHAFDMGQRYVPLTVVSGGGGTGSVVVRPPTNINIAQPGYYNLFVINSAGVPSVGVTVRLTPPPACLYAINGSDQYIEAEGRSRGDGPITQVSDAARSGGAYLQVTEGSGNHTTVPDEGKVLWYDLNVATTGNFFIWALANGPDTGSDTMWVSLDGNADQQLTLPTPVNTWGWVRLSATALNIPAGKHTLKLKVREDGALIDKLALSTSSGFTPSGIANPTLACNGAALPGAPSGVMATPGNGQVTVSWSAVGGATSYTLKRGPAMAGPFSNVPGAVNIGATSFTDTGVVNGTTYYYVVSASNAAGEGSNSTAVSATPSASSWSSQDVGAVAAAGSWNFNSGTGVHTVAGNGADIWNAADEFRFTYQTLVGDGSITARLTGFTGTGTINANAKAGVMIRQSLNADSPHLMSCLPVQGQTTLIKQIRRISAGASALSTSGASPSFPRWVRVTRAGNTLSTFESTNGSSWTAVGSPQVIATLGATTFVGMAVTSHVDGTNYTATFDNVTITAPTPPGAPPGLMCTPGNGQCQLSWSAAPGATSYTVKRSTTSGSGYMVVQANIPGLSFTDSTVTNGTTYYYVVSGSNGAGEGGNSNEQSCLPALPAPPLAPTNLMASGGNRQVVLGWSAAATATSYTVKRSTTLGGPYSNLTPSPTVTSFTDTTAVNGATYFYVVSASNAGGESGNSGEASAAPTLPAPGGLAATPGNNQVTLTWNTVTNATSYTVSRATASGGPYDDLAPEPTAASFLDSSAVNGTTYFYRVRANDATSEGPSAGPVSATPAAGVAAPSNLGATTSGAGTVNLTWVDNASNETGFRVERKVNAGSFALFTTVAVNVQAAADGTTTAGNSYSYRVIATGSPESGPSNEVVVVIRGSEADAHVRDGQATTNFGTATALDVKTSFAAGATRHAYVRFSLTDVAATVTSARLRVFGNAVTSAKTIAVSAVSDITWGESTIIWNNKPAIGSQLTTQSISTTAAFRDFDVTAYVQAQKTAGASKVTFAFTNVTQSDEGPTVISTKENATAANRPVVIVSSK